MNICECCQILLRKDRTSISFNYVFNFDSNIFAELRMLFWARYVASMGERINLYRVLVGKAWENWAEI